jgi:tetratricopeptide (TPR) repeat protein
MKRRTTVLVVLLALTFIPFIASAQSAEDYVKDGIESLDMADAAYFIFFDEEEAYVWVEVALDCFNKAIALNPEYAEAYYWRAECYEWLEDDQQALKDYITAARSGFKPAQDYLTEKGIQW